jgi:Holliday junction resolvase RusA-like endonuclease
MPLTHSPIKPLSANRAYQGRKIKTTMYKRYVKKVLAVLPKIDVPEGVQLYLRVIVHYSNVRSDIDNCLKPFIDILQEAYSFNDNKIYRLIVDKEVVPKGEDGIFFEIGEKEGAMYNITELERSHIMEVLNSLIQDPNEIPTAEIIEGLEILNALEDDLEFADFQDEED